MNCKRRLEEYLRENAVPFQTRHHPRAITAQEVAATEHVPGRMFAKTVVVSTDGGETYMLALPAPYHLNPEKAAGPSEARLAEEVSFAETLSDCELGAVPPFGNLYGRAGRVRHRARRVPSRQSYDTGVRVLRVAN